MGRGTLILVGIIVLLGAGAAVYGASALGAGGSGGAIQQPIPFPHDVHAGTNQIPCMYCHSSAETSVDAGIPSVEVCAGCHLPGGVPMVAADSQGVKTLTAYWEAGEPIPWVRIYDLPDHAHFPHKMHVNADIACQECHGPVEEMAEIEQAASLEMGWCLECHQAREARTDCFVCHY
ncbi:MAG TPA: cytochrome c3 family protein [Longimicrobiales bacterium]|nr:cytochrome c3 family protein [Longimicrobiales bacterium]